MNPSSQIPGHMSALTGVVFGQFSTISPPEVAGCCIFLLFSQIIQQHFPIQFAELVTVMTGKAKVTKWEYKKINLKTLHLPETVSHTKEKLRTCRNSTMYTNTQTCSLSVNIFFQKYFFKFHHIFYKIKK